ncbi:MAG: hypothetical protein E6R08_08665 [Nevskiaceae bacterium]|nr:MAG: hypothetical protein E6R08_08665 [Nevskiaceae bacterium]
MHEPSDIFDLLAEQGDHFDQSAYLANFAPYFYTYVVGYRTLVQKLLVAEDAFRNPKSALRYVSGQSELAIGRIPPSWKSRFESRDWNECSEAPILKAYAGEPLRLDKACLAIKSLQLAFAGAVPAYAAQHDLYAELRLSPAIYVLRDIQAPEKEVLQPSRTKSASPQHAKLLKSICANSSERQDAALINKAKSCIAMVADGYPTTYASARFIRDFFLSEIKCDHLSIVPIPDRTDGGKIEKHCNSAELSFVTENVLLSKSDTRSR